MGGRATHNKRFGRRKHALGQNSNDSNHKESGQWLGPAKSPPAAAAYSGAATGPEECEVGQWG